MLDSGILVTEIPAVLTEYFDFERIIYLIP